MCFCFYFKHPPFFFVHQNISPVWQYDVGLLFFFLVQHNISLCVVLQDTVIVYPNGTTWLTPRFFLFLFLQSRVLFFHVYWCPFWWVFFRVNETFLFPFPKKNRFLIFYPNLKSIAFVLCLTYNNYPQLILRLIFYLKWSVWNCFESTL